MTWLKSNWKFLATILTIVAAAFGVKFSMKMDADAKQPEVIIIVPAEQADATFLKGAPVAAGDRHGIIYAICKIRAARIYAQEKDLPFGAALHLARSVPDTEIVKAAAEAKINLSGAPVGGPLQNLLDWLAAHPEVVQQIIQIILMLIPLFA